jgi:RNA polymerase sigma-70 factor (ECF subfamily)
MAVKERPGLIDELTLQKTLMAQAPDIRFYLELKIPTNLRSVITVEDVLQETWIAAFRGLPGFHRRGPDAMDRWLRRIAQRILINAVKKAQMGKRGGGQVVLRAHAGRVSSMLDLFARVASPCRTPSSEAAAVEAVHALQIALASLPEARRRAIWLSYIEGRQRDEIAEAMNKTTTAVNSLLINGLRQLRERMGSASKFLSDAPSSEEGLDT